METDGGLKMNYTEIHREDAESHGEPDSAVLCVPQRSSVDRCSTY